MKSLTVNNSATLKVSEVITKAIANFRSVLGKARIAVGVLSLCFGFCLATGIDYNFSQAYLMMAFMLVAYVCLKEEEKEDAE